VLSRLLASTHSSILKLSIPATSVGLGALTCRRLKGSCPLVDVHCPNCGLPLKEGDRHMITDEPDAHGNMPVRCEVKLTTFNRKWLGTIDSEEK
jgi:hypothetical protein